MKIILTPVVFIFLIIACQNESGTAADVAKNDTTIAYQMNENKLSAVAANNTISNFQKATLQMVDAVFQSDSATLPLRVQDAIYELEVNIQRVEEMPELNALGDFKNAVVRLFKFYKIAFEKDFKILIPTIQNSNPSATDKAVLEAYDESFRAKEVELFKEISLTQEAFAKANNINLIN
ncbi:hypothetical protein DNU06_08545 [Putridiphycobacter roseus]|uniref:Uncharacterized protein n=1 Tax=Putridiphycobacter roseus TaxID=2219161 RepID=A0A2W1N185_9FLAO|nr:hypothetical protein [Putridiphycobacter roseus]PZE17310.1 hypothetical protein DNU06_08545 [Putridiphycobacter roseus]